MTIPSDLGRRVFRIMALFWLFGWVVKIIYFADYFWDHTFRFPITSDFFPPFFQSATVSSIAYVLPFALFALIASRRRSAHIVYAITITACSLILNLHFTGCNDATFLTSTWVGLWMILLAFYSDRLTPEILFHLKTSGLCLIGLFFLGGTIGKLFAGFTTGETIHGIFFAWRDYWPHTWVREHLTLAQQHTLAGVVAKSIVIIESLLILAPVWPVAVTLTLLILTLTVMIIFCTYNILSVNSVVLGLCLMCLWMERILKSPPADPDENA